MLRTALGVLLAVTFLIVGVYIAVFGGLGSLLASRRKGSALSGFLWGTFLGPVGWGVILWRTRKGRPLMTVDEWAGVPVGRSSTSPPDGDVDLGHDI